MYRERPAENDQEHIEDLIHLYIDGAFDRQFADALDFTLDRDRMRECVHGADRFHSAC